MSDQTHAQSVKDVLNAPVDVDVVGDQPLANDMPQATGDPRQWRIQPVDITEPPAKDEAFRIPKRQIAVVSASQPPDAKKTHKHEIVSQLAQNNERLMTLLENVVQARPTGGNSHPNGGNAGNRQRQFESALGRLAQIEKAVRRVKGADIGSTAVPIEVLEQIADTCLMKPLFSSNREFSWTLSLVLSHFQTFFTEFRKELQRIERNDREREGPGTSAPRQ